MTDGDWAIPSVGQTAMVFDDVWLPLPDGGVVTTTVEHDDVTAAAIAPFDLAWDGTTTFARSAVPPELPDDWSIGVIVGASGSGKSTMLRAFGAEEIVGWDDRAIAAHFADAADASARFAAVGLNSIPTWTRPYAVLSTGERFRADLARRIADGAVIDEFTSVVDRNVAMSASNALRRYVDGAGVRRLVVATCHRDVLPWLQPDWVIDLDIRSWCRLPRGALQRPDIVVSVYAGTTAAWEVFHRHHYLTGALNPMARCFVATVGDDLVGFVAVLPLPHGSLRDAYRAHRTVVLPDFQGLGIGVRLSDFIAEMYVRAGRRYYSRTTHPRMAGHREASPLWRATPGSMRRQTAVASRPTLRDGSVNNDYVRRTRTSWGQWDFDDQRIAWSHEYIGAHPVEHAPVVRVEPLTLELEVSM